MKLDINAREVAPAGSFEVYPEGKYLAHIIKDEDVATKSGTGSMLVFDWEFLEGPHKGKTIKQRLNIKNVNPVAVKIAYAELSSICHAVKIMEPRDSKALHRLPCTLNIVVKKRADNGELTNEIKGVEHKSACMNRGTPDVQDDADDADEAPPAWMQN
jgi:hypothetical protein